MPYQQSAGRFTVTFDGSPLPDDVANRLTEATVDGNQDQPDMFVLTFRDPNRDLQQKTGVKMGSKATISAISTLTSGPSQLLSGEVTAVEAHQDGTGTFTVVRGHDESHRLYRGTNTETYQNMTASDIAQKVCQRAGLQPGQFDSTGEVFEYFAQNNESDMAFLKRLATSNGYVVGVTDGKLNFCKPTQSSGAPNTGDLGDSTNPSQVVAGLDLLGFRSGFTTAGQVANVRVMGFDPDTKKALQSDVAPTASNFQNGMSPTALAGVFGGSTKAVGSGIPYTKQTDVDAAAKAAADHIGGGGAEFHGSIRGNPSLKAGGTASMGLVSPELDGKYTLSKVTHKFDPKNGYTTQVSSSGRNNRSAHGLTGGGGGGGGGGGLGAGAGAGSAAAGPAPVPGVAVATVTDVNDPKKQGRIKVQFPWLSDKHVSDWVPMTQFGAGKQRGAVFLPEVGDLVLVAFDHGDMNHPYVIGSLYNGVDTPKLGDDLIDGTAGGVKRRGVISKNAHALIFFDDSSDNGLALMSGDKGLRISLNQGKKVIKISSNGDIQIEAEGNVSITSQKDISVKAQGGLTLTADKDISIGGQSISFDAKQNLSLKGQNVSVNGSVPLELTPNVNVHGHVNEV